MKKNLKTLAIIFSVVLNIVFLGSYLYHESCLRLLPYHQEHHHRRLYEELNLSRKQLDIFKPIRDRFHAFLNRHGQIIKAKQLELIDLLATDKPDREAIEAKQKEIQALQRQMQARVIAHLLEESKLFTPQQKKKFFALIKGRIEKTGGPRPRWMPQTQASPSKRERP